MKLMVDRDNQTLDRLLWEKLQRNDEPLIVATLNANPGLAAKGHVLPVGTLVHVPDTPRVRVKKTIRLWD